MKYYAVCVDRAWRNETDEERETEKVWTISTDPEVCGWKTDGGHSGYGLTREEAQFLADAANEKLARERDGYELVPKFVADMAGRCAADVFQKMIIDGETMSSYPPTSWGKE